MSRVLGLGQRQIASHLRSFCLSAARPRCHGTHNRPTSQQHRVFGPRTPPTPRPRLLRTAPAAMGSADFAGSSVAELDTWLRSHGIDTSLYGSGASKPLELLLEEVEEGETVLTADADGAQRAVSVVNVRLMNTKGQTLYEASQILPTGSMRTRNLPLSEKMLPGEAWPAAAKRGVQEELEAVLPPGAEVVLDESSYVRTEESKESQSYPQLRTKYVCHRVDARVEGLPEGSFETSEERADGTLRHCWEWRD